MDNINYLKQEANKLIKDRELQEKEIIELSNDILIKYKDILIQSLERRIIEAISKQKLNIPFTIYNDIEICLEKEYTKDYYHILTEKFNKLEFPISILHDKTKLEISKTLVSKGYYITKAKMNYDDKYYSYIYWNKKKYLLAKIKYTILKSLKLIS